MVSLATVADVPRPATERAAKAKDLAAAAWGRTASEYSKGKRSSTARAQEHERVSKIANVVGRLTDQQLRARYCRRVITGSVIGVLRSCKSVFPGCSRRQCCRHCLLVTPRR